MKAPASMSQRVAARGQSGHPNTPIVSQVDHPDKTSIRTSCKSCPNGDNRAPDPVRLARAKALEELLSHFRVLRLDFMGLRDLRERGWSRGMVEKMAPDLVKSGRAAVETWDGVVIIRLVADGGSAA
ncbi:MAG: hypothetical protein ACYC5J_15055 [Chloroflexota bacterium]